MKKYKDLEEYLGDFPMEVVDKLQKIRMTINKAAPEATETFSYNMPTFKLNGEVLVHYAAFKNHIGFFPTPSPILAFENELKGYKTSKGTIQFQFDDPIPYELITKIVKFRIKEIIIESVTA